MRSALRSVIVAALSVFAACGDDLPAGQGNNRDRSGLPDLGSTVDPDGGGNAAGRDAATTSDDGGGAQGADGGSTGVNPNHPDNERRDSDCDGLSDAYEFATVYAGGMKTSPSNADSDGDGLTDGVEAGIASAVPGAACTTVAFDADPATRTSPAAQDTDRDGIPDGAEDADKNGRADANESSPLLPDSDGDRIPDGVEDADKDGTRDIGELDPTRRDSDGDGIGDGLEDANRDGLRDTGETDPRSIDSDGDQVTDGDEDTNHDGVRQPYEIDPRTPDTDCDGLSDGEELMTGTSPLSPDTDRDGLPDGLERGRTSPIAGASCPAFAADSDPASTTDPTNPDSDGDGLADGGEDANHDGSFSGNETDASRADTDGDTYPDGDEVLAGTNPRDPSSPDAIAGRGIQAVCADANLAAISFHTMGQGEWTLAGPPAVAFVPVMVRGTTTFAAVFDGPGGVVSGFVLAMPLLAGGATPAEDFAFNQRLASGAAARGLTLTSRQSPRHVRSHDGFDTAVSAVVDVGSAQGRLTGDTRALLLEIATGLAASDFTSIPAAGGAQLSAWVMNYQLLVRPAESRLYVIAAIVDRTRHDDPADTTSFLLADLSGGTALALKNARRYKGCDPFVTQDTAIADFIWMADISASTDDDRGRIVSAAEQVFDALANNGVDFRMGVVPHSQSTIHRPSDAGHMRGVGFTTDRTLFSAYLQDASGTDGCEFGIDSVDATIRRALPRTRGADPLKLREGAALAVMYISDENAQEIEEGPCWNIPQRSGCPTGIGDVYTGGLHTCAEAPDAAEQSCADMILAPYIQRIRDQGGTAFGQVFAASPLVQCNAGQLRCAGSAQDRNEPGRGYIEVINATGGLFYSPCDSNPGAGPLAAIVDAVTGAASEFQLRGAPIAATIQVGVTRVSGGLPAVTIVPRSKQDGFDYDPVSNSIFFRGQTHRPARGDRVTISYRVWLPPALPCGPCATNQVCDPMLGVCTCDAAVCSACGPNQACDASCNCACVPDCNGNCAPGRACNAATCQCECAPDCGGCPAGTACNPASCACECTGDCGGACAGTRLSCDAAACACECPADCGGRCGAGGVCNTSLCECACNPNCDDACTGRARCNPANACACECPADCSGCQDGTVCDAASCECVCPAGCDDQCPNERVCDPAHGCGCVCPPDCGGCANNEICDPNDCRCVPIV